MNVNEISRGIPHIEDLPLNEFIDVVSNLNKYSATEKMDGAQILFGLDRQGFYTSRESKGGKRIYSTEGYEVKFSTTYMRSAHMLLEELLPDLRNAGLKVGDQVEAEVLYGELPNVVPYSADRCHIIFLRTTEGTVDVNRLGKKLYGCTIPISLDIPTTSDGRTIEIREDSNIWSVSSVPNIDIRFPSMNVQLKEVKSFLSTRDEITGKSYKTIIETPLNKIPDWVEPADWKTIKIYLKEKKEYINDLLLEEHIKPIKEILLDQVVRPMQSHFGPAVADGGFVEGIVLRDTSGKMIKLVDKDRFGAIRESAWQVRNQLTENAKGINGNMSFLGELYVKMATALGHAELGTIQAKRYLKSIGPLTEEVVDTLSTGVKVDSVKDYWINLLQLKERELGHLLDKYTTEETSLANAIHRRTKETFADTFQKIAILTENTRRARTASDLIKILIGKHLGN